MVFIFIFLYSERPGVRELRAESKALRPTATALCGHLSERGGMKPAKREEAYGDPTTHAPKIIKYSNVNIDHK